MRDPQNFLFMDFQGSLVSEMCFGQPPSVSLKSNVYCILQRSSTYTLRLLGDPNVSLRHSVARTMRSLTASLAPQKPALSALLKGAFSWKSE